MKNIILILALTSLSLVACSPQSPETATITGRRNLPQPARPVIPAYAPIAPDNLQWIKVDGGMSQLEFNPRVDILFVIDNSDSMKSAQNNLVHNINYFIEGLQKNKMIDYHIGVTSVWDSSPRFKSDYKIGELHVLPGSQNHFVSKTNNNPGLLAATLNVGIAPYSQGGPENEEIFTPISAAIQNTNTGHGGANEGFFRDDAQLVVVVLTDADDSSSTLTPEQLTQELFSFKKDKREKVSVYAALVKAADDDQYKDWGLRIHPKYHPECFTGTKNNGSCHGFGPDRIEEFVVKANSQHGTPNEIRRDNIMSLVQESFGKDLAKIGNDITVKTLAKKIELGERPRTINGELMIHVRYGNQVIHPGIKSGWIYNADDNSIEISGEVQYQYVEGAKFSVDMIPVSLRTNSN